MGKVIVKQNPDKEIPVEILAQHIKAMSDVGKKLAASSMKQKTVLVLLNHTTGVAQKDIKKILDALPQLEKIYLK